MENNPSTMQNEFSLSDLFYIIKNGLRVIIVATLFFGILAGIYAYSIAIPEYSTDIDVYITPITTDTTQSDYTIARYLIITVSEYLESDTVIQNTIDSLKLGIDKEEFRSKLSVTASTDSYRINVSYQDVDATTTTAVVNKLVEEAIDLQTEESSKERFLPDTIELVGIYATENGTYAAPNKLLITFAGLVVGGIIGLAIAFIKEMTNNSYKTKEQLEAAFKDIQILGMIPEFEIKEDF